MEIQITNTGDKKLQKDYQIIVPNDLIELKVGDYIKKAQKTFSLKGFRKGQVPLEVIKEKYGQSIRADETDKLINESIQNIVKDNNLKLALSPKIDIKSFAEDKDVEVEAVMEIYPEVPEIDLAKIKVTRREGKIAASDIDESLTKLLKYHCKWNDQDDSYKAKSGDAVNIDYIGRIDKKEFEGGAAKGHQLELGTNSFIDNFEDQLVGKKAGADVKVKVKFPKEYHNDEYAGKAAEFEVKVNKVLVAEMPEINDEFVKNSFGLENKEKLEEAVKQQIEGNYQDIERNLFKKDLFDFFNKKYNFDLPAGLVEEQLKNVWAAVEEEIKANPDKFKNDKEKEKAKGKKREMSERMIRCGMILSELAHKNKIEVGNEDINKEVGKILARYPNQEKEVMEYYQKNPSAIQQLKGSILEDKAIDFVLNQESLDKKTVSLKELDKLWKKANESE